MKYQIVGKNIQVTDAIRDDLQKKLHRMLVDYMTGHRDLPAGKNFGDVIKATQSEIAEYVKVVEPEFRAIYVPMVNELVADAQKNGNKIVPDGQKGQAAAQPIEPQDGTDAVEIDPKTGLPKA